MSQRVSARDARSKFAEITDRVRYTGEPVIVEKQGRPFVAVVSLDDLDELERMRAGKRAARFTRESAVAARSRRTAAEPSEEEIVAAVKATRDSMYRERYARG